MFEEVAGEKLASRKLAPFFARNTLNRIKLNRIEGHP